MIKVGETKYFNYFKEKFNCSFRRPQVNICCTCKKLNLKLGSPHLNKAAKGCAQAVIDLDKRKSKMCYDRIQKDINDKDNSQILPLYFDFVQNIQIQNIPVQETLYPRQLSVNKFCIHKNKSKKAHIFMYNQKTAGKGPDVVCSFLFYYLMEVTQQNAELHLLSLLLGPK